MADLKNFYNNALQKGIIDSNVSYDAFEQAMQKDAERKSFYRYATERGLKIGKEQEFFAYLDERLIPAQAAQPAIHTASPLQQLNPTVAANPAPTTEEEYQRNLEQQDIASGVATPLTDRDKDQMMLQNAEQMKRNAAQMAQRAGQMSMPEQPSLSLAPKDGSIAAATERMQRERLPEIRKQTIARNMLDETAQSLGELQRADREAWFAQGENMTPTQRSYLAQSYKQDPYLEAANSVLFNAEVRMSDAKRQNGISWKNVGEGLVSFGKDTGKHLLTKLEGMASFGMSDVRNAVYQRNVLKKVADANAFDNPETVLTPQEKALYDATITSIAVEIARQNDTSRWSKAGQITADMIPFIEDIMIGNALFKGFGDAGREAIKKGVEKHVRNKLAKWLLTNVPDVAISAGESAATAAILPHTYAEMYKNTAQVDMDKVGMDGDFRMKLGGIKEQDFGKSWAQAYGNEVKELFTETGGNFRLIGRALIDNPVGKKILKTPFGMVLKRFEGAQGGAGSRFASMTMYHGVLGEWLEELEGAIYDGNLKDFFTADTQLPMLLSFAVPAAFTGGLNATQQALYQAKYDQAGKRIDKLIDASSYLGPDKNTIKGQILATLYQTPTENLPQAIGMCVEQVYPEEYKALMEGAPEKGNKAAELSYALKEYLTSGTVLTIFDPDMIGGQIADVQAHRQQMRQQAEQNAQAEVQSISHEDGNIYRVGIKGKDGAEGYAFRGDLDVVPNQDGTLSTRGRDLITIKMTDGTVEQVPADEVTLLDAPASAADRVQAVADHLFAQYANNDLFQIGDKVHIMQNGQPSKDSSTIVNITDEGVEVEIIDPNGQPNTTVIPHEQAAEMLSKVEGETEDGIVTYQTQDGNTVRLRDMGNGVYQSIVSDGETPEIFTEDELAQAGAVRVDQPSAQEAPTTPQEATAPEQTPAYPHDEEGNPDWGQIEEPQAAQILYDLFGSNRQAAQAYSDDMLKEAQKVQKAAAKQTSHNLNIAERIAEEEQNKQFRIQADAAVKYWENVKLAIAQIKTVEEQAAADAQRQAMLQAREERSKTEEGTVTSANMAERYEAAPKIIGNAGTTTLPDGRELAGHYVLIAPEGVTASHNATANFQRSEGYPVTSDGQSINDRDYTSDIEEQQKVETIAQNFNGNAIKNMPVISDEGLVYNGNGRMMAGQLAALNNTDEAYMQSLAANAAQFGFTPEQIASIPHARIAFQLDERLPYSTQSLAIFNEQETQTQSNTGKAAGYARKLTPQAISEVLAAVDGFNTIDAFFNDPKAPQTLINNLISAGIIAQREKAEMVDGEKLSATGRERLSNILFGTVFDNETIRLMGDDAALKNSILRALPQILDNKSLGEFSLEADINDAIRLLYEVRKAKMPFQSFVSQTVIAEDGQTHTAAEDYSPYQLLLAEEMTSGGVDAFRDVLTLYNDQARMAIGGQADIFGNLMTTTELKNLILERYGKEPTETERQAAEPAAPASAEVSNAVPSTPASDGQVTLSDGRTVALSSMTREDIALLNDRTPIQRALIAIRANLAQHPDWGLSTAGLGNDARGILFNELPDKKSDLKKVEEIYWRTQQEYVAEPNKTEEYRLAADDVLREIYRRLQYIDSDKYPVFQGSALISRLKDAELAVAEAETDTNPTEAQKKAENYKQGHVTLWGLPITIENPKGSTRRGTDANGKKWEQLMHNTYGKIRRTEGVDGDHIDVFIGPNLNSERVFVVDQLNQDTGEFDEHKVMLGFDSLEDAQNGYLSNYEEGWQGMGTVTEVTMDEFKKWIDSSHRKTKPFAEYKSIKPEGAAATAMEAPTDNRETSETPAVEPDAMREELAEELRKFDMGERSPMDENLVYDTDDMRNAVTDILKRYNSPKLQAAMDAITATLERQRAAGSEWLDVEDEEQALIDTVREVVGDKATSVEDRSLYEQAKANKAAAERGKPVSKMKKEDILAELEQYAKGNLYDMTPRMAKRILSLAKKYGKNLPEPLANMADNAALLTGENSNKVTKNAENEQKSEKSSEKIWINRKNLVTLHRKKDRTENAAENWDWLEANIDRIVEDYKAKNGNVLDPDAAREYFSPIGYDGSNVSQYRNLEKALVDILYSEMLDEALAQGKTKLVLLTGHGGAGKSTATRNNKDVQALMKEAGVVFNAAMNSFKSLDDRIGQAFYKGVKQEDVTIIPVYNDVVTSFENSLMRGEKTGRVLSIEYLLGKAFPENAGKLAKVHEVYPDITITPIDNAENNGGRDVSIDEALQWNYDVTEKIINQILDKYEQYINKGGLTPNQIATIGEGLSNVEVTGGGMVSAFLRSRLERLDTGVSGQVGVGESDRPESSERRGVRRPVEGKFKAGDKVIYKKKYPAEVIERNADGTYILEYPNNLMMPVRVMNAQESDIEPNNPPSGPAPTKPTKKEKGSEFGTKNTIVTQDEAADLTAQLKDLLSESNSLFAVADPMRDAERSAKIMQVGTRLAMYYIEGGARKFSDFCQAMVKRVGDVIRPYLRSLYMAARYNPAMTKYMTEMDDAGIVESFDVDNFVIEEEKPVEEEKPAAQPTFDSPMFKQFKAIKEQYPDATLLFRVGDFYELYASDAEEASKILGITITKRGDGMAFAGFPFHALDTYLPKLVRAGKRVAICDQLENPKETKKEIKRGVTELVETPKVESPEVAEPESVTDNQEPTIPEPNVVTDTVGEITESKHTKTGAPIWVVKPMERVSDDEYKVLKARAKESNGYYSRFVKGFVFNSVNDATRFNNISDEQTTTEQTSADTETAIIQAETVAAETATIERAKPDDSAETEQGIVDVITPDVEPTEQEFTEHQEAIEKIDAAIEQVNEQLAVLGYYEADTSDPLAFHESYGYLKSAEAKALKDVDRLAKQLAADLGVDVNKRKKLATANIAPAGGDISFRLPIKDGLELYVHFGINPNRGLYYKPDGIQESYVISDMYWRVENPSANGSPRYLTGNQNYGSLYGPYGHTFPTYEQLLKDIRYYAGKYLPEVKAEPVEVAELPEDATMQDLYKQAKERKEAKAKKRSKNSVQDGQQVLDLFADVVDEINDGIHAEDVTPPLDEQTQPINNEDNGRVRNDGRRESRAERTEPTGQSEDQNGTVGEGQRQTDEGNESGRVDSGSEQHRVHDGERSGGTVLQPAEQELAPSERKNTRNFRYDPNDPAPTANRARYDANIAAIKLLKQLQDEGRQATPEEQRILAKFTGWGGLGEFFKGEPGTTYYSYNGEKSPYQIIKELLTEEELAAAQLSRNSAYYTPAAVIDQLWAIAKKLGFRGGNILEGSAGIGNILSQMPQSISDRSNIQAVEIDDITAGILAQLYPDATTHAAGFQEVDLPNNSQDLVITNVPFVTGLRVHDKKEKDLSKRFHNIHDFCIAKNVRKLRQGGLVIFISSSGTLDSSKDLRRWLVNEGDADVIGAFRMNRETFGGTSATSDIIVVRKRVNGVKDPRAIDVLDTETARVAYNEEDGKEVAHKLNYNKYFVEHPESMGGEMGFGFEHGDTRWGGTTAGCYPSPSINQAQRMQDWLDSMAQSNVPMQTVQESTNIAPGTYETYEGAVPYGSLILNSKGEICRAYHGMAVPVEGITPTKVKGHTKAEVLKDYNGIKAAVEELLAEQAKGISDETMKPLLKKLNKVYDDFVKKYGNLNRNTALSFLRNDVQWASIAALENVKETVDKNGKKQVTVTKTDVFSKRVVGVTPEPKAENAKDGIILSMQQYGNVRPDMIATWLGRSQEDVEKEMIDSRLAFRDPQTGNMVVNYEYLSGNVREKLAYAEEHNENGEYNTNIEELRKVIPVDIPAHLIEFNIGSTWIPVELYHEYLKEKFGVDSLRLVHVGSAWISNEHSYGGYSLHNEKNRSEGVYSDVLKEQVYGHQLMIAAMNNVPVVCSKTYKNYDGTTETVTDKQATAACSDKIGQIKDDFVEWARGKMQQDSELAERVQKIYNDRFNAIVPMLRVDDAFLSPHLPGQNHKYTLYDHQQQAVVRATTQPVMLAHEVGTGKTITLISAAMEMRRLGTSKKPMIVVQNSTTPQFVKEAKDLYPNAKILTVSERDRTKEGRQEFYAKIKYNDWDLIIVPQSVFDMIPDSEARMRDFIDEKIQEKIHAIEAAKEANVDKKVTDRMERELKALQEDLETNNMSGKRSSKKSTEKDAKKEAERRANAEAQAQEMLDRRTDEVEDFDDMGIDALLIDEAHNYKHLGFATMMARGVKGIDPSYSKRAAALYLKCQSVYERCGHKNVVFATGTPISNTAAEIWTFMKYLMPKQVLKDNDIYYFDDFVHNFGKIAEQLEFATNGKFKANNRFAQYGNVPELMRLWLTCADCVLTREVGQVNDKVPQLEDGKAQDIFLPQSPSLIDIMAAVRAELERYEKMSGKEKKENSHIPLTMYGVAKRAAIDPRLVDENAADEPLSKTNKAVEETLRSLKDSKKYNGTVAIFCDSYQNKQSGFNLFEDIKAKLVKAGVPAAKVAIIRSEMSDTAKQKIFDAVREGEIRVIMGSTQTLGTGVNIQTRLHCLIHMDAPDRPMDYTQRNGRIVRQGNMHRAWDIPVRVLRFGVEDSLDVTSYQRLKTKAGFIDSIMNGKSTIDNNLENRVLEDVEEGIFDNPVAMLSGSQYALLKSQAERDLRKWEARKKQHEIDQMVVADTLKKNARIIEYRRELIATDEKFLEQLKQSFPDGKVTEYNINGTVCHNAKELKEALKALNAEIQATADELRKNGYEGTRRNMQLALSFNGMPFNVAIVFTYKSSWEGGMRKITIDKDVQYTTPTSDKWLNSPTKVIDKLIEHIEQDYLTGTAAQGEINYSRSYIERLEQENELMRQREGKPFMHQDELDKARALVDDYTKKMQEELAEKEAKYANQASSRKVELNEEQDEDETTPEAQITDLDYPSYANQTEAQQLATSAIIEALNDNTDLDVSLATDEDIPEDAEFSIRREAAPKKTGIGYKVFYRGKDGKLYPPMVANPNGADTPVGVWLNADAAPVVGETKTGRPQVKAGGKGTQGGSGTLAYRPGWHLGEIPYALQFNRKDENGEKTLFPKDFVWAEVEYAADVDYQQEANEAGINKNGNYEHAKAGLKHLPTNGYYRYRTNPNPETDPWIITGAMKVNRVLTNEEVDEIVRAAGREPQVREPMVTTDGTLYGWAIGDRIYLTKAGLNPNTPIHEYTHLWAKAMRRNNREGWQSIVNIFKDTPFWQEVVEDENYASIRNNDDAICSEVLARYSGTRGAARMEEAAAEMLHEADQTDDLATFARTRRLISRVRQALSDFWHWVGVNLFGIKHFDSAEQVADRVLFDLLNQTELSDLNNDMFYSNAEQAVREIRQAKATPEQWLAMITKNGGIKAGEDKWLGLSDWLKEQKGTLTKRQVLDYIRANKIQIEEEEYVDSFNERTQNYTNQVAKVIGKPVGNAYYGQHYEGGGEYSLSINGPMADYQATLDMLREKYGIKDRDELGRKLWEMVKDIPYPKTPSMTRLKYTTTGLKNKREIALTVPTIDSWEAGDNIHFGDAGEGRAIAWVRFGDAYIDASKPGYTPNPYKPENKVEQDIKDYIEGNIKNGDDLETSIEYARNLMSDVPEEAHGWTDELIDKVGAGMRRGETLNQDGTPKVKVLVIDEIQSNRHQEGREKGYKDESVETTYEELKQKLNDASKAFNAFFTQKTQEYGYDLWYLEGNDQRLARNDFDYSKVKPEDVARFKELNQTRHSAESEEEYYRDKYIANKRSVPAAPFEKNWHELAMKRILRYAAENGYDKVAWTTGDQQAERYEIGKYIDSVELTRSWKESGEKRYDLYPSDGGGSISLFVKDGIVTRSRWDQLAGKPLESVVGKGLAKQMLAMDSWEQKIENADFMVGGEGMKGFYDDILPRFMQKYSKKWGANVGEVYLPKLREHEWENAPKGGLIMHSVDVTDAMRESVMQGQPMFMISRYTPEQIRAIQAWNDAHPHPQYQVGEKLDHYAQRLSQWEEARKQFRASMSSAKPSAEEAEKADRPVAAGTPAFVPGVKPTPTADESPAEYALRLKQYYQLMRDEKLVADYVAEINAQADAAAKGLKKNTLVRGLLDAAKPIENFQEWMAQRGATMTDGSNAYTDTFLASGRVSQAHEQLTRDILRPLAKQIATIIAPDKATGKSRLDGINITWQNMDVPGTGSKIDGKALTPREIIGVYCQAKDCAEAIEKGLPDRGAKGFERNLGMTHDQIISEVESRIPRAELDEMWRLINAATHFALNYDYESGRISEDTHTEFYQREFYVPQRGWRERDESALVTEYEPVGKRGHDPYNAALVKAHGRQSLAADPFAYIMSIDASSIISSENNKIKQKFLRFCLDNEDLGLKTGAFRVKKYWIMNVIDPETGRIKLDADGNPMMEVSYSAPSTEDLQHDKETKQQIQEKRKQLSKIRSAFEKQNEHGDMPESLQAAYETKIARLEQAIEDLENQMHIAWHATNTNISQRTSDEKKQHEVQVLLDGEKYVIELQDEKLANAINKKFKQHQESLFDTTQKMRNATRFMSAMLTQYNPEFAASNFARDYQVALATLMAEHREFVGPFMKYFATCQGAVWKYAFNDKVRDREAFANDEMGQYLREYFASGAPTGFSYMQDLKSLRRDFDAMVNESNVRRGIKGAVGVFAMLTEVSETAVRFAGFVAARKNGMGLNEAAYLSKELTTNFDRAGEVADTGWMAWFSFFRATLNGNLKFLKALKKMPLAYSLVAVSYFAMGMLNQFLNPDDPDDEIWASDYTRQSNFVLGKIRVPVAHFMRMFFGAGVNAAQWIQGNKTFGHAVYNTATFASNEMLPNYLNVLGNGTEWNSREGNVDFTFTGLIQGAMPSPVSPITDVWFNRDFRGATINREPFTKAQEGKKDILMGKEHTLPIYKFLTQAVYEGVGGSMNTEYKSADPAWRSWLFDISPSSVEHVVEGYIPAGADMFITLGEAIYDAATGTPTGPDKWPFVRKFYNAYTPERAYMQQYYLLNGRVKEFERELKDYQKNDPQQYRLLRNSQQYRTYQQTERLVKSQSENPTTADVRALIEANKLWLK